MKNRFGCFLGICCCLPVCVWAAGTIHAADGQHARETLLTAVNATFGLQAAAIAAFMPTIMRNNDFRAGFETSAVSIFVPLPVLAIAWLGGAASVFFIAKALAALLFFSFLACHLMGAIIQYFPIYWVNALGLASAILVWRYAEVWLLLLMP